jgi:EmrB/QacA subfamily drug resistance transporter
VSEPDLHESRRAAGAGGGFGETVSAPWPLVIRHWLAHRAQTSERYRWWVLWTVLAGLFSVNVTFTIFAVALPRVAGDLGTTENTLTWVITGPLIAFGVVAPAAGKAGDIWGHRRLYLLGTFGALICAGLSAVAWNTGSLIAFRTLGALEGAATGASSMALIFNQFDRDDRVKAMGWWSLVGAGGPVIGVAIGGPLIEAFGWRWIFAAQIPLIGIALLIAGAVLREMDRTEGPRPKLDVAGAATAALAMTSLLFALNRGPEWGWSSPLVVAAFLLSPVAAVAFVTVERTTSEPLIPLEYLKRRNFALPIGAQAFSNFAYMGGFILAPSLLARVFEYGESRIGLLVVTRPLAFSLTAPIAGYLAVRLGERFSAVTGTSAVVGSMLLFSLVGESSVDLLVVAALVLSGVGLGMSSPSIAASVANSVDEASFGIASAAQQLVVQVGLVAGIQLMKTIQTSTESGGLSQSFQNAYLVGAGVAVLGVVCAAFVRSASRASP